MQVKSEQEIDSARLQPDRICLCIYRRNRHMLPACALPVPATSAIPEPQLFNSETKSAGRKVHALRFERFRNSIFRVIYMWHPNLTIVAPSANHVTEVSAREILQSISRDVLFVSESWCRSWNCITSSHGRHWPLGLAEAAQAVAAATICSAVGCCRIYCESLFLSQTRPKSV